VTVDARSDNVPHVGAPGYFGTWSPDSRFLEFGVLAGDSGDVHTYVFDTVTRRYVSVDSDPAYSVAQANAYSGVYAPDSSTLLFLAGSDIWLADPDGSNPRKAVDGPFLAGSGQWRPDD
jgi:Tol biopolymer transport system component